jgi:glycosyltransferase involved in cell wall biosynthesis
VTESSPIGSVAIPAHNEAAVIRRCLDALLVGFLPGELDVVVVCNGCKDGTADIARSCAYPVRVIEVPQASKPAALRAADDALTTFPRLYLDADVILPTDSARVVLDRLRSGPALAARPPISYDTVSAPLLVRSFYRARARVPAVMGSLWGAGVYGLSAAGRARFGAFPDVIADDLFVDQRFRRSEIEIVSSASVVVAVPRRTADLFRILRRTYRGNAENRSLTEDSASTTPSTLRGLIAAAAKRPGSALDTAAYLGIATVARATLAAGAPAGWERDDSSRGAGR